MKVRTLAEAEKTERRIVSENWESTRLILQNDGVGFSFHITKIYAGTETPLWYRNHFESVYCIAGEGEIENREDGNIYPIRPGTLYLLDKHDRHILRAKTELSMACVFNPPLHGKEVHDKDGAYALTAEAVTTD